MEGGVDGMGEMDGWWTDGRTHGGGVRTRVNAFMSIGQMCRILSYHAKAYVHAP